MAFDLVSGQFGHTVAGSDISCFVLWVNTGVSSHWCFHWHHVPGNHAGFEVIRGTVFAAFRQGSREFGSIASSPPARG
jgi:hypothetical protein